LNQFRFFVQIVFLKMAKRKNIKSKSKKGSTKKDNGLAKIATMTTKSLSSAIINFKKNPYPFIVKSDLFQLK